MIKEEIKKAIDVGGLKKEGRILLFFQYSGLNWVNKEIASIFRNR